jgi:Tfp pilus assembly protein PilF
LPVRRDSARPSAGTAAYLEGLGALEKAHWSAAVTAFTRAVEADDENPDYHTARGVALTLAEQLPQAISELERSLRLRPGHRETRLWLGVAYKMGNEPAKAAANFVHGGDVPVDYASFIYNDMAHRYWNAVVMKRGGETGRDKFPQAGAWFAKRAKAGTSTATPELTGSLLARARERFRKGDYTGALADLDALRGRLGDELDFLTLSAFCRLELGGLEGARREFTRALTKKTDLVAAYRGRALAAARQGDARRARADQKVAARLDPKGAVPFAATLRAALGSSETGGEVASLVAALHRSAEEGTSWKALVKRAAAVRRAAEARRTRFDEDYQDRLRRLEEALRERPGDPDRLEALAAFLYRGASVPRGRVEPRGPYHLYRYQTPQTQMQELARAEYLCDQALLRNPKHPRALATKVALRMWHLQYVGARAFLMRLVALGTPDDPEVALRMITLIEIDAARRRSTADALRSTRLVDIQHYSSFDIYTWRHPSAADLRSARELDRQADLLIATGLRYLQAAVRAHPERVEGLLCLAALKRRSRDWGGVREALERAVKLRPGLAEAQYQLADAYAMLGLAEQASATRVRALNLLQTTAAPRLREVWSAVARTRWKSARVALAEAQELDPADARNFAYLGVVAAAQDRPDEAAGCFWAALALEEARARAEGTTFGPGGKGLRPLDDLALTLGLRLRLAPLLLSQRKAKEALEVCQANLALQSRVEERALGDYVPGALLPDPKLAAHTLPEEEILASLLSWSRLYAGRALQALGRPAEAAREWVAVVARAKTGLSTSPGRARLEEPRAWAALALARQHLDARDLEGAQKWLFQSASWNKEAEVERKRLQEEVRRLR